MNISLFSWKKLISRTGNPPSSFLGHPPLNLLADLVSSHLDSCSSYQARLKYVTLTRARSLHGEHVRLAESLRTAGCGNNKCSVGVMFFFETTLRILGSRAKE